MPKKYAIFSLEDEKTKKLAESLSNKTARKILNYLKDHKEAGTKEISKELKIPISTADYTIKKLEKACLLESKYFIWSKKGNKVNLYKLSKKPILISTLTPNLNKIIPLVLGAGTISLFIEIFSKQKFQKQALEGVSYLPQMSKTPNFHYGLTFFIVSVAIILLYFALKRTKQSNIANFKP